MQSVVENLHCQRPINEDTLVASVVEVNHNFDGVLKFSAIDRYWLMVLDLIEENKGGNDLVEIKCGSLTKPLIGNQLPLTDVYSLRGVKLVADFDEEMN